MKAILGKALGRLREELHRMARGDGARGSPDGIYQGPVIDKGLEIIMPGLIPLTSCDPTQQACDRWHSSQS